MSNLSSMKHAPVSLYFTVTCSNPFRVCVCWLYADDDPDLNKWFFSALFRPSQCSLTNLSRHMFMTHAVMVGKLVHGELLLVDL